ncbi:MAG: hypothetical protein KAQ85_01290, partial [Thermodesulfovibrionia bacterium]|nr:hypothetical protein [Thermodesulfovibrionia bacterium]
PDLTLRLRSGQAVGGWTSAKLSRMPSGLILNGTCIFSTLKGRVCVPPNVSNMVNSSDILIIVTSLDYLPE